MSNENDIEPRSHVNPNWRLLSATRRSACDNRPGLKKMYLKVLDDKGEPLLGVKVRFDTEPSSGIVYDHPNFWGVTGAGGHLEWDHLGIPTRYMLYMEEDRMPFITNIRTDFGNEYCEAGPRWDPRGWRPVNRPGIYSYDIEIRRRW